MHINSEAFLAAHNLQLNNNANEKQYKEMILYLNNLLNLVWEIELLKLTAAASH